MVNTDDFIKRLEYLMDYYSLNASGFADKIGVQRSSISHLLSGRNKPSLDFVMKILDIFPDVNLYWILDGKQSFLKNDQKILPTGAEKRTDIPPAKASEKNIFSDTLFDEKKIVDVLLPKFESLSPTINDKIIGKSNIFKIVIFYNDGTFKDFVQSADF